MKFVTPEEIGLIMMRLVQADEQISEKILLSAEKIEDKLLPDDLEKLKSWIILMKMFNSVLK